MNNFDQVPYNADEFAMNPEPRCPCVLVLDTSYSMNGSPINELNDGLLAFKDEIMADSLSAKRVEVAIVGFGPVEIITDFVTADRFDPPSLSCGGNTPMGEAITTAINLVNERKNSYRQNGIQYFRPWIFMITDGAPTDEWRYAADQVRQGEEQKSFQFFAVGIEGASFDLLSQISVKDALRLKDLRFRDLFAWLSSSLASISRSQPSDTVPLTNPAAPNGWGEVIS